LHRVSQRSVSHPEFFLYSLDVVRSNSHARRPLLRPLFIRTIECTVEWSLHVSYSATGYWHAVRFDSDLTNIAPWKIYLHSPTYSELHVVARPFFTAPPSFLTSPNLFSLLGRIRRLIPYWLHTPFPLSRPEPIAGATLSAVVGRFSSPARQPTFSKELNTDASHTSIQTHHPLRFHDAPMTWHALARPSRSAAFLFFLPCTWAPSILRLYQYTCLDAVGCPVLASSGRRKSLNVMPFSARSRHSAVKKRPLFPTPIATHYGRGQGDSF